MNPNVDPEPPRPPSSYWKWAIAIHVGALVVVLAWLAVTSNTGASVGVAIVLGMALLIGLAFSGTVGKILERRRGLLVGLALPFVSALLLGGTCIGLVGGFRP